MEPGSRMVPMMLDHTCWNRSTEPGSVSSRAGPSPSKAPPIPSISSMYAWASRTSFDP